MSINKAEFFDDLFSEDYNFYVARFAKPIEFIGRDSKNLLVTIGDNWTRGFNFGETSPEQPFPHLDRRYGEIISEQLGWDFLTLSIPSMPNLWMAQKYQQICENYASMGYDRVKVIITFAEYGREFSTQFDAEFPELVEKYKTCSTAVDAMRAISSQIADILAIDSPVELSVGLAYTSNLYPTSLNCLPMTWAEVLKNEPIPEFCVLLLDQFVDNFKELARINPAVDLTELNSELDQLSTAATNRRTLLNNTGYTLDPELCWPNALGHQLWADYILANVDFS